METGDRGRDVDWGRFGLGNDEPHNYNNRARPRGNSGGFVDLGNEYQYAAGGHQASGANEIFAEEQGDKPWWRTNFFISQPVLFGTWDGVFTSCLINIFGVIVFLRSGWIVAQAGIINAILIIFATVVIALVSVLSAIGICERCRIESGGVYFLIAHTLGSRFGGSLGVLYCFGQAVGCALNVLGFGESMAGLVQLPGNVYAIKGFAITAVLLLSVINVAGVKWVIKLQLVLLVVLLLSAVDFIIGSFVTVDPANGIDGWLSGNFELNLWPNYQDSYTWFRVFGVFFPTVTGILSGINMSGDLKNPSSDIPNGSISAFSTATVLYLIFILFLGAIVRRDNLMTDFMIVVKVSAIQVLLLAGIYVSSMSSCLGAMYGTPRVLQCIANESVIPGIGKLGKGRGPNKVPIHAMAVVAVVTITFIIFGNINSLAPIVTMPFLLTYACIDYSYFALAQTFDIQSKREERFRIQAQSPSYETRRYGTTNEYHDNNDLDQLFPERTRHKDLSSPSNSHQSTPTDVPPSARNRIPNSSTNNSLNSDSVIFRDSTNSTNVVEGEENGPLTANRQQNIHSKTKNWYSGFCNRWASLAGAGIKILIMFLVHWIFALVCLGVVLVIWLYVGTTNPAVKPGLAQEFRFFVWLKSAIFKCFGKRINDYDQVVVTPSCPGVAVTSAQLNEENEDFQSRRRYHQSSVVQGHYVEDI